MNVVKRAAQVVAGLTGAAVGGTLGSGCGAALGIYKSASFECTRRTASGTDQFVIPNLVKSVVCGGLLAGGTAIFGLQPETWPIVSTLPGASVLHGPAAGFVAGCIAYTLMHAAVPAVILGFAGAGIGLAAGASIFEEDATRRKEPGRDSLARKLQQIATDIEDGSLGT